MKNKYKYLIFDVDDTLLDFYSAFTKAQKDIAGKLGIEDSDEYRKLDEKCGWKAWTECGLEDTKSQDVKENYHTYYYHYIEKHFTYLIEELGIDMCVDELVKCYVESISSSKELMEADTLRVYSALAKKYKLILATNGIKNIQKPRISEFLPYTFKTYISEEMGCIKPSDKYFEYIIQDLGCEIKDCLMIGDSMSNDIIGAKGIGMDVCYYNIRKKANSLNIMIDYEINSIVDLERLF